MAAARVSVDREASGGAGRTPAGVARTAGGVETGAVRTPPGTGPRPGARRQPPARLPAQAMPGAAGWVRYGRRRALAGAAAAGFGAVLAACGPRTRQAAPAPARTGLHLLIQLNWQGIGGSFTGSPVQRLADEFIQKHWASRHAGVSFTTILGGGSHMANLGNSATVASILAGSGPDVVTVCCSGIPALEVSGILTPLDSFIKQDNVNLDIFPAGVLSGLSTPSGVLGLPNAGQTEPLYVNLSLLDTLGLPYPDPAWDHMAAARLWRSVARLRQGKPVYGACLNFAATMMKWLVVGFGGTVFDPSRSTCLLDRPADVAAFEWLVPQMWNKVVIPRQSINLIAALQAGQVAFATACCGSLGTAVATWKDTFKWDLVPMPAFPHLRSNGIFHALYGINGTSKAPPELLWGLLKFLCVEKRWQMFWNASLALAAPNQITPALWEEWMATVRAVVPFTKSKHLEYYAQAAATGQGWAFAKYAAAQAATVEETAYRAMLARQQGITGALHQAAAQITALERAAAGTQALAQGERSAFPVRGTPIAKVGPGL